MPDCGVDYLKIECSRCRGSMFVSMCGRYRSCVCARCILEVSGAERRDDWARETVPLFTRHARKKAARPLCQTDPIATPAQASLFGGKL